MTSLKQIEANRRNALKSTGPRSEQGKRRASRNAIRHGLTAETVVKPLEDLEDYKLFEEAIGAPYDAETAVERELILRLASLLWRLRRASSIETTLFELAAEWPSAHQEVSITESNPRVGLNNFASSVAPSSQDDALEESRREVARRFLHLALLDKGVFERLNRYELALWRQARQTLFALEALRWGSPRPAARSYLRYPIRDQSS